MTTTAVAVRYEVVCGDFRSGPYRTVADAERKLASIEKLGACQLEHRIEEVR